MTDISVIVPIYNVEKYLVRCLDSLLLQTHKNFEIILVNDGSPDTCGEICDAYLKKDSKVKVIHQSNQGVGAARNRGLECAAGKYIYFCDPDDYVEPKLLEDNLMFAEKHNANMVIFGYFDDHYTADGNISIPKVTNSIFLESQLDFREGFENLYTKNIMYTLWNKLYKKEFLDYYKYRFGSEKVGQDTIFNYKIYTHLDRVFINDKTYYHYIINRMDSSVNKYREDRFYLRYKESMNFESLVENWGYEEKYRKLVLVNWLLTLSLGINNVFSDHCRLNNKEKKEQIKKFINDPKIASALKEISVNDIESLLMKVKVFFLKNNLVSLVYYIQKFKSYCS